MNFIYIESCYTYSFWLAFIWPLSWELAILLHGAWYMIHLYSLLFSSFCCWWKSGLYPVSAAVKILYIFPGHRCRISLRSGITGFAHISLLMRPNYSMYWMNGFTLPLAYSIYIQIVHPFTNTELYLSIIIFCPFSSNEMGSCCDLLLSYSVMRYCYDGHVLIGRLDFFCEEPVFFSIAHFFLLVMYFTNIFSWFVACPFTILMVNVDELRLLVLVKFNLSLCI